jgi:hypothetical protein
MANTKKLPRGKRKTVKRQARRKMKAAWGALTPEQRRQFAKAEKTSLKKFIASLKPKEEVKPAEAAPAAPAAPTAEPPATQPEPEKKAEENKE